MDSQSEQIIKHREISWRGIFTGTLISLLIYLIMMAIVIPIGGSTLQSVLGGTGGGRAFGIGSAIWMVLSVLVSLFVGGYLAARVSGPTPMLMGGTEGLVIAALFFGLLFTGIGSTIGAVGSGLGASIGSIGSVAQDVASNERVQSVVRNALGGMNLQSPPQQVAQGLATRLLQGDQQGAVNYLAQQAGITPDEASQRISTLGAQVQATAKSIGLATGRVIVAIGWTIFLSMFLGSICSVAGGVIGALVSLSSPISERDRKALSRAA